MLLPINVKSSKDYSEYAMLGRKKISILNSGSFRM